MDNPFSSFAQSAHTLPRNFTFHYQDGELPKTPEPAENIFPQRTSPPPMATARVAREPYRLRRRRAPLQATQRAMRAIHRDDVSDPFFFESHDVPVPSIELTNSAGTTADLQEDSASARVFSPPKTPLAQIYSSGPTAQEASSSQEDVTRPSTACSDFSSSSKSSSIESFPSFGESSSPKSQHDPFTAGGPTFGLVSSPLQDYAIPSFSLTSNVVSRPPWTQEMDDHLWITYMRYLQDPRHTPFKMLPGTAPPPGVCSRVVREAKRNWKGHLTSAVPKVHRFARWGSHRAETPETYSAQGAQTRRSLVPWPRSDAATRKRLRDLCKLKPTLSAHYGRLLHARSPSPFLSSSGGARSTSLARDVMSVQSNAGAFSTRDMNISLVTSTSTTMQPSHPLVQLSSEFAAAPTPRAPVPQVIQPEDATTPRPLQVARQDLQGPPRTPNHQKSMSMQERSFSSIHPRPLASPFRPLPIKRTSYEPFQPAVPFSAILPNTTLAPPAELHAPVPRRSIFKRPAHNELNDMMHSEDPYTRQHHLMKELFGEKQPIEVSHRRVRSRGFSLGDMTAASRLDSLFSGSGGGVPAADNSLPSIPHASPAAPTGSLLPPPSIGRVARLGSPFAEKPATKTHFNTFPRSFSLIGLEPAMDIEEDAAESIIPLPGLGQS